MADDSLPIAATRHGSVQAWALGLIGACAIVIAYARVFHGDFLWDDDAHIYANPTIVGPLGLKEIWTSGKANYFPLTMTSFWVQHALWGLSPGPYHFVTLLFHVGAALLLWRVLLLLRVPGAWLGAMLWALHPVQVESVAWICELKNTQSAFFYLLAIWFFIRWIPPGSADARISRNYVLALVAAILAILSKSSTAMLPVVLGLAGWWQGRRRWRDALWLLPFFAVSLIASGWTIWEQKVNSMASGADWDRGLAARLVIAGKVPWFYLGKLLWPHPLVFIYPRWEVSDLGLIHWLPLAAAIAVLSALWHYRERTRGLFLGLAVFGVSLFPVLGLFDVFFFKYSFVGDHFQYLASMGPLVLLGAAVTELSAWFHGFQPRVPAGIGVALLGLLGLMTVKQTGIYLDREALWSDTVERNPRAWIARMNLGSEYMATGRPALAIPQFEAVLQLRPGDALAEANWGGALYQLGKPAEAVPHLENALRLLPGLADACNSLGLAYAALGRTAEAQKQFETALQLKPGYETAGLNLCNLLVQTSRAGEAEQWLSAALLRNPRSVAYHRASAIVYRATGRTDPAIEHYRAALQLSPGDFESLHALIELFTQKGQYPQAIESGEAALRLRPDSAESHYLLGNALLLSGRAAEAVPHYEQVLRLRPDYLDARGNLGTALYNLGRAAEAVPHYLAVAQAQPKSAGFRNNLASALMQSGRLPDAIQQYHEALQLEPDYLEARMNLALALEAAGQKNEALEQYTEVLRRKPDHLPAQEKLKRLRAP